MVQAKQGPWLNWESVGNGKFNWIDLESMDAYGGYMYNALPSPQNL